MGMGIIFGRDLAVIFLKMETMITEKLQSCIDVCNKCAVECESCVKACLQESTNIRIMKRAIELDKYCAEICRLAAHYLSKGEAYVEEICQLCAKICDDCAAECKKYVNDHCKRCAEACNRCAAACHMLVSC